MNKFSEHYQKLKIFYNRYERWLMPTMLFVGFLADYVTFVNIEINTALIILFIYWIVCALAIFFIYAFDAGKIPERFRSIRLFVPLVIQFTFGGLLSNSFIFYWFSGSIWVSWPFILAFVILMISNDAFRHYFLKPILQLSVFYFATFSIFSVILPFKFNSLNPWLFVLAGIISFVFIILYIFGIRVFAGKEKLNLTELFVSIFIIFFIANLFYFLNLIPPVPLALREVGVYHNIIKNGNKYVLKGEQRSFWQKLLHRQTIHLTPGERAYVFSAIFAPKALSTKIIHEWQYKDEIRGEWITKDKLLFNLTGGRKEGFRGYTLKTVLPEGKWRVFVKTPRGQALGRITFKIQNSKTKVELVDSIR